MSDEELEDERRHSPLANYHRRGRSPSPPVDDLLDHLEQEELKHEVTVAARISTSFALWQEKKDGAYILHAVEAEDEAFQETLAQQLTILQDQFGKGSTATQKAGLLLERERSGTVKGSTNSVTIANMALAKTHKIFKMFVSLLA